MQLQSLKISNLLSFPYLESFETTGKTVFSDERTGGVNILIGPNGAGKSNFLEIVNQIFKFGLITDYVYNKQFPLNNDINNLKNTIQVNKTEPEHMKKNFLFLDKPSQVEITLQLSRNDFDNLGFLCKYSELLNKIIGKYGNFDFTFPTMSIEDLQSEKSVTFQVEFDIENKKIKVNKELLNEKQKFIYYYMKDFELLQICMDISNDFEKKPEEKAFYPLKNTFSILGAKRNFDLHENAYENFIKIDPTSRSNYLTNQSTKSYYSSSFGYFLCLNKLAPNSIILPFLPGNDNKIENSQDHINKFHEELNQITKFYLDLDLEVHENEGQYRLMIKDGAGFYHNFDELSSGTQSILMIILTIFGYDMENGMMVIDEPELHLHPQLQKTFIRMLNFLAKKYSIQFILATHSPIMVNEYNIRNVYKFTKNSSGTLIQAPLKTINEDEASLVQMLKFENMSKMFFVEKIIAVEGMTDTYFMDYYLEYLSSKEERKGKIQDYEILDIQGKGSFRMWKKFLGRFGVKTYFIGDWDNIIENQIITDQELNYYRSVTKQNLKKNKNNSDLGNKRFYTFLVYTIKQKFPDKYKYIVRSIEKLYEQNVFIFKQGDLESYLGLEYKGLDKIVEFCNEYFQVWLTNPNFDDERQELDEIFRCIFK